MEKEEYPKIINNSCKTIKWLCITAFIYWLFVCIIQRGSKTPEMELVWVSIPFLIVCGYFSFRLCFQAEGDINWKAIILGSAFMIGGVLFDVFATLYHTPDLKQETNPFVIKLFDEGYGLKFIYVYGALAQFLILFVSGSIWAALIRHINIWLKYVLDLKPKTFIQFLCFSFSGKPLSMIDFLIPFGRKHKKNYYFLFWILVPMLGGVFSYRWLLGFHWFNLMINLSTLSVFIFTSVISYIIFFVWLYLRYRNKAATPHQE